MSACRARGGGHWENLCNFGILPLEFEQGEDYDRIEQDDTLVLDNLREQLRSGNSIDVYNRDKEEKYAMNHRLSHRQVDLILKGGVLNFMRERLEAVDQKGL